MGKKIYESCDRAIRILNRKSMKEFEALKLADFDSANVIRTVRKMYRKLAKQAEGQYRKVAHDAYMYGLMLCGPEWWQKAERMADKAVTKEWVRDILEQTDFVTLYRFDSETERKADRLVEAIAVVEGTGERGVALRNMKFNRNDQIDAALRLWTKQVGQYAVNMTDYAMLQAYDDAGIEEAEWLTEVGGANVCARCKALGGKRFKLDEFPSKPHIGCRCSSKPVVK